MEYRGQEAGKRGKERERRGAREQGARVGGRRQTTGEQARGMVVKGSPTERLRGFRASGAPPGQMAVDGLKTRD